MNDPIRILCVDDEENILKAIRRLLADEDMEVLTALSGEEGLEILRTTPHIGVIISDQRMPGMLGAEFLEKAREAAPDAPRIMLTGYADISATIDAINKGGAYRYLSKPWDDEGLIRTVREAHGHYRIIRENRELWELVRKQNEELQEWNANLKSRVLAQTASIRAKIDELRTLNEKLKKNYEGSLLAFSGLLELRDRETGNHCGNVADISVKVAEKCGCSPETIEEIRVAALLHDIGKIGASDTLLQEEIETLSADEVREYRLHPVRGQAAMDSAEDLRSAGVLIRHHHENYDGSGFPDGLKGEKIPLGARIIALADAVDRIFSKTRGDNGVEITIQEISPQRGNRFDPQLFPILEPVAREKYRELVKPEGMIETELRPGKLRRGMMVTRDVRSGTGLLLLAAGERLDEWKIQALTRYYRIDPPEGGIMVLVRSRGATEASDKH